MKPHALLTAALFAGTALTSHATLVTVTGGDPGEGYAPLALTFAAVDSGGVGGFTMQGIAFAASNPNLALSVPTSAIPSAYTPAGFVATTADDASLLSLVRTLVRSGSFDPFTLTISGLAPGTLYQVDSFIGASTLPATETVSAVGLTTLIDAVPLNPTGVLYDVRQSLQPDATGKIVLTYAITAGQVSPLLTGISVTTAVPEPSAALLLLALGLPALLALRRRKAASR